MTYTLLNKNGVKEVSCGKDITDVFQIVETLEELTDDSYILLNDKSDWRLRQ